MNIEGPGYRVAVVGATGQVGTLMLQLLRERAFPMREVIPFASSRSVGRNLDGGLVVQMLTEEAIQDFDLAIFSAGASASAEWAPRFVSAGAVVVDNSSYWRMQDQVPLVVSEVNPEQLELHEGIISNPNCTTMQLIVALKPLYDLVGIERLVVCTYQAVSGIGKKAVDELLAQSEAVLRGDAVEAFATYPKQIAFNVFPQAGNFPEGDDLTVEEHKLINETRKILGDPEIKISATCVRVPVVTGHSIAVNVQTKKELTSATARAALNDAPGVVVLDEPSENIYPTAVESLGRDEVFVGRIRRDPGHERTLDLWIVADNLRKGAATNAVQIAELLDERGLIRSRA